MIFALPLFGFGNDSCKLNTTFSIKCEISCDSDAPLTNKCQSCVNPSRDIFALRAALCPMTNSNFIGGDDIFYCFTFLVSNLILCPITEKSAKKRKKNIDRISTVAGSQQIKL